MSSQDAARKAPRLPTIESPRREVLTERGRQRLDERNAEKWAWKAFQRARDLHRVDLTSDQLRALLQALGVRVPNSNEELVAALSEGLEELAPAPNRGGGRPR